MKNPVPLIGCACILCTIFTNALNPHASLAEEISTLNGTVWKIVSWATDDEHIGFYEGRCYYIVGEDLFSPHLLEDSFYRDYDRWGFGAGVIPERLVNYPGDIVFWGFIKYRTHSGSGMALPLPVPALLVLKESEWEPVK